MKVLMKTIHTLFLCFFFSITHCGELDIEKSNLENENGEKKATAEIAYTIEKMDEFIQTHSALQKQYEQELEKNLNAGILNTPEKMTAFTAYYQQLKMKAENAFMAHQLRLLSEAQQKQGVKPSTKKSLLAKNYQSSQRLEDPPLSILDFDEIPPLINLLDIGHGVYIYKSNRS